MPNPGHPYDRVRSLCLQHNATLVAVTKTRPLSAILEIYDKGQRIMAENRAQDLVSKAQQLPTDIEWHLIGHLQTNKVEDIIAIVTCIQSLDSEKLWAKIDTSAAAINKQVMCLLQIKVATEESKYGWDPQRLDDWLASGKHKQYRNVVPAGIMGMTTLTKDQKQVRKELKEIHAWFQRIKEKHFPKEEYFGIISMGMSGDFEMALEEGSNMVRIGSLLFPGA